MDDKQKLEQMERLHRGAVIIEQTQEQFRQDGYKNMLNKYGTKQDNSTSYEYEAEAFVDDMTLTKLYEGNGLFTKIISRPAEEAVKHGLDIDFGDDDIKDYVEERLEDLGWEEKFATAEKWARLYGGSIIVMLVDDGRGLEEPLNWNDVRSIEELRVFERSIVQPDYSNLYNFNFFDTMNNNKPFAEPEYYQVFSMYGYFVVHRSRCLVFRNGRLPEHTTNAIYRYWGIPEYVKIRRALRECLTSHGYGVRLLERCVQAIYKFKNLSNLLATADGEDKAVQRLQIIDLARNILNTIAIDADGEDYDFKQTSMSGVKDVIDTTCNMLSAVTDIPQTILFGRSPAGMNSTGESDMENYYNMVENIQKQNMKRNSGTVIDLVLIQGLQEGKIPEKPRYKTKFAALWSSSDTEQANIEQTKASTEFTKAQTAQLYVDMGAVDPKEVRSNLQSEGDFEIEELVPEEEDKLDISPDMLPTTMSVPKEETQEADSQEEYPAAAVLVVQDGKILCASRRNGEGLCGPGGHTEEGETPEQTATREAMEEFNIVPLHLIPLCDYKASSDSYVSSKVFLCDRISGKPEADGDEMLDARWLSLEELSKEALFPPFEESIHQLVAILEGGGDNG